jgi:CubicO group peptidase (beta-lactamase class C family)
MCLCDPCDERTVEFTAFKDAQFDSNVNDINTLFGDFLQANQIPGGAVGIIRDNQIVVLRGRGLASISPNRDYTVGTPGLVGSVSKTLTALGMLVLAEQNKVNFSKSINDYLPIPIADYDDIKIRQLLSHTSGIENKDPSFGGLFLPEDEDGLIATCQFDLPAPFEYTCGNSEHPGIIPRSAYYTYYPNNTFAESAKEGKYSNINFMLLGTIIDMVTRSEAEFGESAGYENFIWRRVCLEADILSPCLMAGWRNIKNLARGYRLSSSQGAPALQNVPYPASLWGWEGPPGGWTMTIGDLCRLMIGINLNRIIGKTARDEILLSAGSDDLGVLELPAKYGHGVFLFDTDDEGQGYLHHGDIDGFTARFTYYKSHDVGVALILNRENVSKSKIGQFSVKLRDHFASGSSSAMLEQRKRQPCSAIERLFLEYSPEIARLVKDVNKRSAEIATANTTWARFLITTEGERGKRLLRHFSSRDYEQAAGTALEILESRQPKPIDRPTDWV